MRVNYVIMFYILAWFAGVGLVLLARRLTSSAGWSNDLWVAIVVASFSVGLSVLARNRRAGR